MWRFSLPIWLFSLIQPGVKIEEVPDGKLLDLKERLSRFNPEEAYITIIMPIYNEEENLIATLDSISRFKTNRSVELLLINNNSSDN